MGPINTQFLDPVMMGHPEHAVPVYLGIMVLLLTVWLAVPITFLFAVAIRIHKAQRQASRSESVEVLPLHFAKEVVPPLNCSSTVHYITPRPYSSSTESCDYPIDVDGE